MKFKDFEDEVIRVLGKMSAKMTKAVSRSCSVKKIVLKNFAKFTGKRLSRSLRPQVCNFIKNETLAQVFFCEYCKIFRTSFTQNTSGRPPLRYKYVYMYMYTLQSKKCL